MLIIFLYDNICIGCGEIFFHKILFLKYFVDGRITAHLYKSNDQKNFMAAKKKAKKAVKKAAPKKKAAKKTAKKRA